MDVRQWREQPQPEYPSTSTSHGMTTRDHQQQAEKAQEENYRRQIKKAI